MEVVQSFSAKVRKRTLSVIGHWKESWISSDSVENTPSLQHHEGSAKPGHCRIPYLHHIAHRTSKTATEQTQHSQKNN